MAKAAPVDAREQDRPRCPLCGGPCFLYKGSAACASASCAWIEHPATQQAIRRPIKWGLT